MEVLLCVLHASKADSALWNPKPELNNSLISFKAFNFNIAFRVSFYIILFHVLNWITVKWIDFLPLL